MPHGSRRIAMVKRAQDRNGKWRDHYWPHGGYRWYPIPQDRYGFPTVRWLRAHGADVIRSEVVAEKHRSLCGKFNYTQGYRFDYYLGRGLFNAIPFYARSNEVRGEGEFTIVCWPISGHH